MSGIFISYRREDTSAYAGRLWENLSARFTGTQVFIDLDSLSGGVPFAARIHEAIQDCSVLVAVIGPSYVTTVGETGDRRLDDPHDFVRQEVSSAVRSGVPVIPVLVGGATLPRRDELPKRMSEMLKHNAIEITDQRWRYDVGRLVAAIEASAPEEAPDRQVVADRAPARGGEPARGARRRRSAWIVAGLAVVALIAGGAILASILTDSPSGSGGEGNAHARSFPCVTEVSGPESLTCLARISASDTAPPSSDSLGTTTYRASNALDGKTDTAWRGVGDSSGESLRLTFPVAIHVVRIGLIPGYAKTDPVSGVDRFVQDRKVVEVRYVFDNGTSVDKTFTQSPTMQYVPVDVQTRTITIEIVRTAAGRATSGEPPRDYTPISEIDVRGRL